MSPTEFEKRINEFDHDELVDFLTESFESDKRFKSVMTELLEDHEHQIIFDSYIDKLYDVFYSSDDDALPSYPVEEAEDIRTAYKRAEDDHTYLALFDLNLATYLVDFTNTYGDMDEDFYDMLLEAGGGVLDWAERDESFWRDHRDGIRNRIHGCGSFGFGVEAELLPRLIRVMEKWEDTSP